MGRHFLNDRAPSRANFTNNFTAVIYNLKTFATMASLCMIQCSVHASVLVTTAVEYSCKLIITLTTGSNFTNNFTAVIYNVG
jgi:hypothetical protein